MANAQLTIGVTKVELHTPLGEFHGVHSPLTIIEFYFFHSSFVRECVGLCSYVEPI
jgi:hypothetical protein